MLRGRSWLPLLIAAVLLGLAPRAVAGVRSFRLIAYDYKQRVADTATYVTYGANLEQQIRAAEAQFVVDPPTLAFLPEDTGLMAWLVGPRGQSARQAAGSGQPNSSVVAIASLGASYGPQVSYYQGKCPGITAPRALVLALTDTAWRAFSEPLARVASERDIWIMANLNVADVTVTRDPSKVGTLADPEKVAGGYAYEGGCEAWNTAFLYPPTATLDPDGAADPAKVLAGAQKKIYLVPIERDQNLGLALSSESPGNARTIGTPFARLGVLTSKDAWMVDVVERLEIDGMDVFLQPEAGAWAGHGAGLPDWPPDTMTRAVWSMVQWQPEAAFGALADLTGNFGDLYFDGTATVTRDAQSGEVPAQYLLGRLPQPGILARAPWVFPDPPAGVLLADVDARRANLDPNGAKLAPLSGDALENGQLANFVSADVTLPSLGASGVRLPGGPRPSVAVAPGAAKQWAPSLATDALGVVYAAWTDLRDGFEQPYVARSVDGGLTWSAAVKAGDRVARPFDQQDNQYDARLAVAPDRTLHLAWVDFRNQSWDVYASRSLDSGATWTPSVRVDHSPSSAEGFPNENLDQDPGLVTLPDGAIVVAWSDARGRRVDRGIVAARSADGGVTWAGDVGVDGTGMAEADQWAPALAVTPSGLVAAAWQDHRDGINQIYFATSTDGGASFRPPVRLAPSVLDQWQPAIALDPHGRIAIAWSEGAGGGARQVRVALVGRRGRMRLLDPDPSTPPGTRQARSTIAYAGRRLWVAWQDDRAGDWDILASRIRSRASRPVRVDDGPNGTDARLPSLAGTRRGAFVAWEDTRTGAEQSRVAALR